MDIRYFGLSLGNLFWRPNIKAAIDFGKEQAFQYVHMDGMKAARNGVRHALSG